MPSGVSEAVFTGRYRHDNYLIEKFFVIGEGAYPLPFLLFKPDGQGPYPVALYLHEQEKDEEAHPGGQIEWFVQKGYLVVAPDLPGRGEIGPERFRGDSYNFGAGGRASYNTWFLSIHLARSLLGIQTGDLIRVLNYVKSRNDVNKENIIGIGRGELCPILSHAAAFDQSFTKIALFNPLVSFKSLAINRYYLPKFMLAAVPGSIPQYDLPDLYAAIAPRRVLLVNVTDQIGQPIDQTDIKTGFEITKEAYENFNAAKRFNIRQMEAYHTLDDILTDWLTSE